MVFWEAFEKSRFDECKLKGRQLVLHTDLICGRGDGNELLTKYSVPHWFLQADFTPSVCEWN